MAVDEQAWAAVCEAIDELNEGLSKTAQIAKLPDTVLFGSAGQLSSLQTLNLIFLTEQKLRRRVDGEVAVAEALLADGGGEIPETLQGFAEFLAALVRK